MGVGAPRADFCVPALFLFPLTRLAVSFRFPSLLLLPLTRQVLLGLLVLAAVPARAQQLTAVVRGIVRDARTGEPLVGATVGIPLANRGAVTGADGTYTIANLAPGRVTVQATFVGYATLVRQLTLTADRESRFDARLESAEQELGEATVEGTSGPSLEDKLKSTQMSVERLTTREAKLLPALFGEVDILKTLQLKPGVQNGGEGTTGLFVRGGSNDQNLVLLDGATVYNPQHLFGLFSVFNSDAISKVDLYKGGFPAQFGGRLSSVVDVTSRDGDDKRWYATGGIGLISSRLTVEGPIWRRRVPPLTDSVGAPTGEKGTRRGPAVGTLVLSGRRTYFDLITRQLNRMNEGKKDYDPIPNYYFQDFNAKTSWTLSDRDQLTVTGYLGRDIFGFKSPNGFDFDFRWGNTLGTARWTHTFSPQLVLVTTATSTNYKYEINNRFRNFSFGLSSRINDLNLRSDLLWTPDSSQHSIQMGVASTYHRFGVGRLQAGTDDGKIQFGSDITYYGSDYALYFQDDWAVTPRLTLSGGLRLAAFANGSKWYAAPEPRLAARYALTDDLSVKASYTRMRQYVHLVSNSGASLPTDIWYPSNKTVKPQDAQQVALGVSKLFGEGRYLFTQELYYKDMRRVVDFRDGAQLFANPALDEEFLFGRGRSYGLELYLEKVTGRTTGWIGYTLARAERRFNDRGRGEIINGGRWFATTYDRRHNLTIVGLYKLNKRLNLTGSFVYTSGNPTTLAVARFILQDLPGEELSFVPVYPDRNSYRLSAYHRADLGLVWKMRPRHGESDLTFSIYNVYNRRNPYFIYYDEVRDEVTDRVTGFKAKQVSLFPVIPAVTYNFRF